MPSKTMRQKTNHWPMSMKMRAASPTSLSMIHHLFTHKNCNCILLIDSLSLHKMSTPVRTCSVTNSSVLAGGAPVLAGPPKRQHLRYSTSRNSLYVVETPLTNSCTALVALFNLGSFLRFGFIGLTLLASETGNNERHGPIKNSSHAYQDPRS